MAVIHGVYYDCTTKPTPNQFLGKGKILSFPSFTSLIEHYRNDNVDMRLFNLEI